MRSGAVCAHFARGLKEAGYVERESVAIEYRWAEGRYDRLPALVNELVDLKVAVIFAAGGTDPAKAAKAATTTIPIVFISAADPVKTGLVASLSRPGSNITGVSRLGGELIPKRLQMLAEVVPNATTFGFLVNPTNVVTEAYVAEAEAVARIRVHADVVILEDRNPDDAAVQIITSQNPGLSPQHLLRVHGAAARKLLAGGWAIRRQVERYGQDSALPANWSTYLGSAGRRRP